MIVTQERIAAVIRSAMPDKARLFSEDTDLIDGLGFDSVNLLELISALEAEFVVTFQDNDLEIECFQTPKEIVRTVSRYYG
jgi:acyl carrier protein